MQMTIAKRIVASTAALGFGLMVAGVGVVVGFLALQRLVTSTHEEFHELRDLRGAAAHVKQAERLLSSGQHESAGAALARAVVKLNRFDRFQREGPSQFGQEHARDEEMTARDVLTAIAEARAGMDPSAAVPIDSSVRAAVERASDLLDGLTTTIEQSVADLHTETAEGFNRTLLLIVALEIAVLFAVVGASFLLYRNVVTPLRRLREGTSSLAEGKLDTRMQPRGDREFVELQHAFNAMASELQALCENLERRVAEKSQELAVAERLASVGYLAAGVAHEINNPLAIMSGYAESLLRTAGCEGGSQRAGWIRDLETIRDEAFRCKRITQSLLDLSRLGDEHREPVAVAQVVESCARLIGAWPASQGVRFEVEPSNGNGAMVLASEPELKQVVLNLLVNAVEATAASNGTVSLAVTRKNGWVDVAVRDNGKGMAPETLARVFQPFFTTGKPRSGLGLGLSISHAIARRHGGMLEATSPGEGHGSTIVLRLPALEGHAH